MNPRRPPLAYLISEGSEPLTFTNVFPRWEKSPGADTQVQTPGSQRDGVNHIEQRKQTETTFSRQILPPAREVKVNLRNGVCLDYSLQNKYSCCWG